MSTSDNGASLRKVNYLGRARKDDNAAARAVAKALRRKVNTEKLLRQYGREPVVKLDTFRDLLGGE
jgi:hypothetical protein